MGSESHFYSVELGEYVRDRIPNSQLHLYEGADHSPHLGQRERFLVGFAQTGVTLTWVLCNGPDLSVNSNAAPSRTLRPSLEFRLATMSTRSLLIFPAFLACLIF